jgi:hypothetical protein
VKRNERKINENNGENNQRRRNSRRHENDNGEWRQWRAAAALQGSKKKHQRRMAGDASGNSAAGMFAAKNGGKHGRISLKRRHQPRAVGVDENGVAKTWRSSSVSSRRRQQAPNAGISRRWISSNKTGGISIRRASA